MKYNNSSHYPGINIFIQYIKRRLIPRYVYILTKNEIQTIGKLDKLPKTFAR